MDKTKKIMDTVTLLIENCDDGLYLLLLDNEMISSLPSIKTTTDTWTQAINTLLGQMLGLQVKKNAKLCLLYRVWCSDDSAEFYYHAVFNVSLARDVLQKQKRNMEGGGSPRIVWKSLADVGKTEFFSPEIIAFFNFSPQEQDRRMKIFESVAILLRPFIEAGKESFVVGPAVKEVFEQLVVDSWNQQDQLQLIQNYQLFTCPYLFMGPNVFKSFLSAENHQEEHIMNLFRAADLTGRGALTCKEFLCIIAFLEPVDRSQLSCVEAEARYIFRYFNKRKNGVWNVSELEGFFVEIRKKYKATPVLEKDIAKFYRDTEISANSEVSLLQFVKAVTSAKFKVRQGFLKNNFKMTTLISPSMKTKFDTSGAQRQQKHVTINSLNSASAVSPTKKGLTSDKKIQEDINIGQGKYKFGYHVVKVNKGNITEHLPMDNFSSCMSNIALDQTFTGRELSLAAFSLESPHNEVLLGLKYFAKNSTPNGKVKQTFSWERVEFNQLGELVIKLSNTVIEVFKREPRLLKLTTPVYVLGDIHGNYTDLWLFDNAFWPSGLDLMTGCVLLLGDYVDRGPHGVEVIAYLFANKIRSPKRLFMVRGNHEIRHVQKQFTFFNECQKKFGKDLGNDVWKAVNNAFDHLPLAALIDDTVFGCHGGVPPPWLCPNISVIDNIPTPLPNPDSQSPLAWELLWNDPIRDSWLNDAIRTELALNDGFAVNKRRGTAHMFSAQALDKFLKTNKLSFTIRAHEVVDCGFKLMQNGKLATIFSSSYYSGMTNKAACMLIQDFKIRVISLVTDDYHQGDVKS